MTSIFDDEGADIIFVAGTPGSKWSAIAHALMYADRINRSDIVLTRTHQECRQALHFGSYFGPGMEYGRKFNQLGQLNKEELLAEFAAPYSEPGGIKLLKSHMFSRHLDLLADYFPKARFLLVHRSDRACLDWWERAGGFSIGYPDYSWYGTTENMAAQIATDNAAILSFAAANKARLILRRSMTPILSALGLSYSTEVVRAVASTEFEQRWGLGADTPEATMVVCHNMAQVAATCVV